MEREVHERYLALTGFAKTETGLRMLQ